MEIFVEEGVHSLPVVPQRRSREPKWKPRLLMMDIVAGAP